MIRSLLALCLTYYSITLATTTASATSNDTIQWSNQTATSLAALDPAEFLTLTQQQLASIPPNACAGFGIAQLANTGASAGSNVCSGFTPACVQHVPWQTVSGLSAQCLSQLSVSVIQSLTGQQIGNLPDPSCASLQQNQTAALTTTEQCSNLDPGCIAVFTTNAASGLQASCIRALSDTQIASFTASSIGALSLSAVAGISGANNGKMTSGCAGFTAAQFSVMPTSCWISGSVTPGWSIACSQAFTPAGLGGWSRVQMRSMPPSLFWVWTVDQVRGLSPLGASGISPLAAKGIPFELCAGFHKSQIALFRDYYVQHVCEQWSGACLAEIDGAEYVGFTQECMQKIRPSSLTNLTAYQIQNILPTTFSILSDQQLAAITPASCSGITGKQMGLLDYAYPSTQCSGLSPDCVAVLSGTPVSLMTPQCASHLQPAALTVTVIGNMRPSQIIAFTPGQCSQIDSSTVEYLLGPLYANIPVTNQCLSAFGSQQCSGFSVSDINYLTNATGLAVLSPACMGSIPVDTFENLDPTIIARIPASQIASLSPAQCAVLPGTIIDQLSTPIALSQDCIAAFNSTTCGELTTDFFNAFTAQNASLIAFDSDCLNGITCDVWTNLDSDVISSFNLTSDASGDITSGCQSNPSEGTRIKTILIIVALSVFAAGLLGFGCAALNNKRSTGNVNSDGRMPLRTSDYVESDA